MVRNVIYLNEQKAEMNMKKKKTKTKSQKVESKEMKKM